MAANRVWWQEILYIRFGQQKRLKSGCKRCFEGHLEKERNSSVSLKRKIGKNNWKKYKSALFIFAPLKNKSKILRELFCNSENNLKLRRITKPHGIQKLWWKEWQKFSEKWDFEKWHQGASSRDDLRVRADSRKHQSKLKIYRLTSA